jgi:UDP-glucose 4-epimerase
MRVLVTGGAGFIGSRLVKALEQRGDDVVSFDLQDKFPGSSLPNPGNLFDITEDKIWDEVYHLACVNQEEALSNPEANLWVNAYGARHMADIAKRAGARFVYTSTASVYGNQYDVPSYVGQPESPKSDYAVAKLAGEHFVKNSGADFTVFRLSNVYGPGQTTQNPYCGVVAKFFDAAMAGKPLQIIGDGSQTRDFTYVEDILPHLMNPDLKGVLN